ncbi:BFN domain-containing protein [Citrus sinensis]|nr:BFN domain-containing protein [Citrus sinensis]
MSMLSAPFCVRTVSGFHGTNKTVRTNAGRLVSNSLSASPFRLPMQLCFTSSFPKSVLLFCKSSRGSFGRRFSKNADDHDHDFLQASLLVPETMWHHRMRKQGYRENMKWQSSGQLVPFSVRTKEPRGDVTSIGPEFLRRFQSPTIFLKISCDGDFLLPIIVGEFAVDKLLYALLEDGGDEVGDCPDQFQFVKNVVEKLGYEVKMVRITERVVNTYFAKLYLSKPGKNEIISVDVRPSDAINVANRCEAPIYVSKHIVLKDAIRIGYGMGRAHRAKATYDVSLDSAAEGPDSVTEEFDLVKNMDIAVREERYNDAAKFRDKLLKLRKSIHDH